METDKTRRLGDEGARVDKISMIPGSKQCLDANAPEFVPRALQVQAVTPQPAKVGYVLIPILYMKIYKDIHGHQLLVGGNRNKAVIEQKQLTAHTSYRICAKTDRAGVELHAQYVV